MHITVNPSDKGFSDQSAKLLNQFTEVLYTDPQAFASMRQKLAERSYPRKELAEILATYNKSIGNWDTAVQNNIAALAESDSACALTGQQLGFMGGPSYTILKGISCLLTAKEAKVVPVFWLATEDHDRDEIDHTYLLNTMGNLEEFHLSFPRTKLPVEELQLSAHNIEVIKSFLLAAGCGVKDHAIDSQFSSAMAKSLVKLFAGTGLVFVEPYLLRALSVDFIQKELAESSAIKICIAETSKQLQEAGGNPQLHPHDGTNLFFLNEQKMRHRIFKVENVYRIDNQHYQENEIMEMAAQRPQCFSTDVAARAVLQSALFPTIAYIAGPSEIAYYLQLGEYHRFHMVPMPCIVPRISATIIPTFAAELLAACQLKPWEPLNWPDGYFTRLEEKQIKLSKQWQDSAQTCLGECFDAKSLEKLVLLYASKLFLKAKKKALRQLGIPTNAIHLLKNLIHPHGKPQERLLNWWGFQGHSTENLVQECLKMISWNEAKHLYIYIS